MNEYTKHLKHKMMMARILGIMACIAIIAGLILKLLAIIDEWLCIISIAYSMGVVFAFNSNLQDIKIGNPWQRINAACSLFLFASVIFLIVYGFVSGELSVQF